MLENWIFLLLILIGYFIFNRVSINEAIKHRYFINYVCLVLVLQSGLRNYAVGTDTYAYYLSFMQVSTTSWDTLFEQFYHVYVDGEGKDPGYNIFVKVFQIFSKDFTLFLLSVAMIFFSGFRKLQLQYLNSVSSVLLSVFLYFALFYSFFSVTGIRQTIAVGLSIHALSFVREKRLFSLFVLSVIAFTIHKSAAFIPLLYVIYWNNNINRIFVFSLLGFLIFAVLRDYFVNAFREAADYEVYVASKPWKLMLFYFIFSIIIYVKLKNSDLSFSQRKLFNLYIITFMWIPVLGNDSLFMRQVYYFSIYIVVLLPFSVSLIENFQIRVLFLFVLYLLLFYLILFQTSEYKFFWQEMKLPSVY